MDQNTLARPYLRSPSLSPDGTQIAFVYAGDLWLVGIEGGDAQRITAHPAGHSSPRWSNDGRQLLFSSSRTGGGDLYVMTLDSGGVRRITKHETAAVPACWTGDDSAIYFVSDRNGLGAALYRVGADGGTPIAWGMQPHENLDDVVLSPDGTQLALAIVRNRWWRRGPNPSEGTEIWVAGNVPGLPDTRCLTNAPGMSRWPLWDSAGGIYFVSDRSGIENLWHQPPGEAPPRQITNFADGRLLWPSISADRQRIVFERDFGIWQLDLQSQVATPIAIRVRPDQKFAPTWTSTYSRDLSELVLSPDGKKLAFVIHGEVFADFADKETDKDMRQGLALRVTNTAARECDVAWTSDSRKVLYVSDRSGEPEVFAYDFGSRAEAQLTRSPFPKSSPVASPDGQWVAYASGTSEIRLIDLKKNDDQPFIQMPLAYGDIGLAWSPDSQWLAFVAQDQYHFENVYVQQLGETQPHQITFLSNISSDVPLWAPNGQFIIFTTNQYRTERQVARVDLRPLPPFLREAEFDKLFEEKPKEEKGDDKPGTSDRPHQPSPEQPLGESQGEGEEPKQEADGKPAEKPKPKSPVEIVFAGIDRRLRLLTPTQIDASALCISADSRDLIFRASVLGKPNLWHMPLDEPRAETPARQLTANSTYKAAAQFAPDGKLLYFLDGGQIVTRKFPNGEQNTPTYLAEVQVDFHQEKLQIFHECHRLLRDYYYDSTFGGQDWDALREQYTPLIIGAQNNGDLYLLLNLLMGELRTSHMGFGYNGQRVDRDGYLGLSFDPVLQAETGQLIVASVLPDGPAAIARIAVGDELLAIDDQPLGAGRGLDEALHRTAGRRVRARLAGPEPRELTLRPIGAGPHRELQYRAWVQANEAIVQRTSNGQLGYVHIPEMDYAAYQRFLVDVDTEAYGRRGLVIDVRFNGGGHTATFFLDLLMRRNATYTTLRGRAAVDSAHVSGNRVLNRPTVLVTNERSYSNAEMFSESYRQLGVGKIVGRPTGGAVIWTWSKSLIDGSYVRLPRLRVTTLAGEDLEGIGRPVDHDVVLPLGDPGRGSDPQLEAAVRVLLESIEE